ncbi:MAG: RluA family pseudouridine synthase [Muribaculaceae bacterium]|nr:RluA family pseudouridine synthase [Muribaculaceae bacterium]
MNNPFDYTPDEDCGAAFRKLIERLDVLKRSDSVEDRNFCREIDAGKMLGVLIAVDSDGVRHTLYAFSGQLGSGGFHFPGFVGPVFDYLDPDGYFKIHERKISAQNAEIKRFEEDVFTKAEHEYGCMQAQLDAEIGELKAMCRRSKLERDARRQSGVTDEDEAAAMIRQSQFEKAELHRMKLRAAAALEPFARNVENVRKQLYSMREKRRADSEALQQWLFSNFRLLNANGMSRSLAEIFADTTGAVPPSGAGECCAPKLLQAAYLRGWQPVAIAEYWYGKSKDGEVRRHGEHYPACRGKCLPVLSWMLQGLSVEPPLTVESQLSSLQNPEILCENRWFCVVDKPSGMLSVPGKGEAMSVQRWLDEKYGADRDVKVAHRLDQDTSGLLIATFGQHSFKLMQSLFATRRVHKCYVAELEGDYRIKILPNQGRLELPLSPDFLDRPRQRVDSENGKESVTEYEFTGVSNGRSRVMFYPLTGRTHQLRVHSASEQGLGIPIVGDRLYGKKSVCGSTRLLLHAHRIEFTFPADGQHYIFESPVPF